jgi:predicted amino acid-binding ACT domain protein
VHVPDRPGVISGITQALGAARINIEDFELHHFTPDRGGTIELTVAGLQAGDDAVALLDAQGYTAIAVPVVQEEGT